MPKQTSPLQMRDPNRKFLLMCVKLITGSTFGAPLNALTWFCPRSQDPHAIISPDYAPETTTIETNQCCIREPALFLSEGFMMADIVSVLV